MLPNEDAPPALFHGTLLPGVRFMSARGWDFAWRKLATGPELTLLEAGGSAWRVGSWTGVRLAGSLSLVQAGELAVGTRVLLPGDFFHVELDPGAFVREPFAERQLDGGEAVASARRLARVVREQAGALAVESALIALLTLLVPSAGRARVLGASDAVAAARRMRDVLHARFAEDLSLADLTRAADVSRWHGVRAFRLAYGVTPFEYLMHVRLARAAAALRAGERAAEVASATGFSDQAHLTRWFARMFRVTPAAFARAHAREPRAPGESRGKSRAPHPGHAPTQG